MTRKEAHLALCKMKLCYIGYDMDDSDEARAIDVAIEALTQLCENCKWCEEIAGDRYSCSCPNSLVLGSYFEFDFYCKYWAKKDGAI